MGPAQKIRKTATLFFRGALAKPAAHGTAWVYRLFAMPDPSILESPQIDQRLERLPPYKVILHNDNVNTFEHVILTILKLTHLKEEEAIERTIEAYETGQSVLLITHRERAELYCEQFRTYALVVTCEPDV